MSNSLLSYGLCVACQAPLSSTVSWSLLRFISIELVMLLNHLILCCPLLLLPSILPIVRIFSNESAIHIRWPSIGTPALAWVLPMNIQHWFPLGLAGLISLQSKGLSRVFSNTTFHISSSVLNLLYGLTTVHDYWKKHCFDYTDLVIKVMSLLFNIAV